MSTDDRIQLRHLPPVAPVTWPERVSMTLARNLNRCPRSGYLYVKTGGGAPTHAMDRGTGLHEFAARLAVELVTHGEASLFAPQPGEFRSSEQIAAQTAGWVDEILSERRDLVVSQEEADAIRRMAYNLAVAWDVEPSHIVAVERKFTLELDCGWVISGKIDLATLPTDETAEVRDYKTSLHVPPEDEWDTFQTKLYAVLLLWGVPVDREPCPAIETLALGEEHRSDCAICKGRGTIEVEQASVGTHVQRVTGREIYPRKLFGGDGVPARLPENARTWTRLELAEFKADLERLGRQLSTRLETWDFPARHGSWCSECPSEPDCPIPRYYRRFAGHITTEAEATEAWAWAQRIKERVSDTEKEVKSWAAIHAETVTVGDFTWEHVITPTKSLKRKGKGTDWEGLEAAITGALERGEEFDLRDWIKEGKQSSFKKVKVKQDPGGSPAEVVKVEPKTEVQDGRTDEQRADERWGADAPWG